MTDNNVPGPDNPTPPSGQPPQGQPQQPPPYIPPDVPVKKGRGQMRQQQPGVTQPRPPTLAEQRARQAAQQAEQERFLAEEAAYAKKRKVRKRLLIGGGVTVGVVGLVAIWYAAASPDNITAQCTQNDVVVDDDICTETYYRSHGGYSSNGFIYIGSSSYRYYYGGPGYSVGQKVSGGSYTLPKGANVTTKSGTTIQRGGFGLKSSGSSGGS